MIGAGDSGDPSLGAPEGGAELGDLLLDAVGIVADPTRQVAVESAGVAGPVGGLMRPGALLLAAVYDMAEAGKPNVYGIGY